MDNDSTSANVVHKPPPLNSDQLNYLIWRYLQEAGYADAAVKLQRDWKVDIDALSFAKHIKGHALVTLVQKGLRYHHLSLTVDDNGQQTKILEPSMFFFGPESARSDPFSTQRETMLKPNNQRAFSPASTVSKSKTREGTSTSNPVDDPSSSISNKRGRKPAQSVTADRNGFTTHKPSATVESDIANGIPLQQADATSPSIGENAPEDVIMTNGTHEDKIEMHIDAPRVPDINDVHMEEPVEEVLPPLIPTLSIGASQEVQVTPAKVSNLGPTSAILSLAVPQNITRASWRPADVATLIAQGETFCGVWNLTGQNLQPTSVKPIPRSLFPSSNVGMVTATAWDPSGSLLAVATHSDRDDQIHLFDGQDLSLVESLPASQRAVTLLKWHMSGSHLFGIAPFGDGDAHTTSTSSTLLSWHLHGPGVAAPETLQLPSIVLDFDCAHNSNSVEILAAGENAIYRCTASPRMDLDRTWISMDHKVRDGWTFVRSIRTQDSQTLVIAAAADSAALWIPNRNILVESIHNAQITGLDVRRRLLPNDTYTSPEFATSSEDGTAKIWQINEIDNELICLNQLRFDPAAPVMCLSYSPDGFALAGASYNSARIWNAQHGYHLMASWEGTEPEWRGSQVRDDDLASAGDRSSVNDGDPHAAYHSLAWHIDSKKLAFGLGSQMAVINFQR